MFKYVVTAIVFERNWEKSPIEFEIESKYDSSRGDFEYQQVREMAHSEIKRMGFGPFTDVKIKKTR